MKYYIQIKNNKITNIQTNIPDSAKPYFTKIETGKTIYIGDTYINGVITHNATTTKTFDLEKIKYKQELNGIQKWLADNDWKINKIVIGEWTTEDPRWQSYLEERTIKRKRYDELLAKVGE